MRNIRPIRDDADLAWAIGAVDAYFANPPVPGSAEADRFDVLADLIEADENRHHAITAPDPVDLIRAHMENSGREQSDLAFLFGSRSRASEVLRRKQALTVDMIHRLSVQWGIPAEHLVVPYPLAA